MKDKRKIGILAANSSALSYLALSTILAAVAEEFPAVSQSLVQMIITIPSFMILFVSLISGKLSQYISKKKLMLAAIAFSLAGGLIPFFIHSSIYALLFGSCIIGIGSGILTAVSGAMVCDCFDGAERGKMLGYSASAVGVGGMLFTFAGGQISKLGWHYTYLTFLILIPVLLVAAFCLPEQKPQAEKATGRSPGGGLHFSPYIICMLVVGFFYFIFQNAFNTNSAMYIKELQIGSMDTASFATVFNALGGIAGGLTFNLFFGRLKKQIQTGAMVISAAGFMLAVLFGVLPVIFAGGFLVGLAFALFNASGTLLISHHVPEEKRAMMIAVYIAVINFGAFVSPIAVNALSAPAGGGIAVRLLVSGIGIAVFAVIGWIGGKRYG